jgi:hypothetical protein
MFRWRERNTPEIQVFEPGSVEHTLSERIGEVALGLREQVEPPNGEAFQDMYDHQWHEIPILGFANHAISSALHAIKRPDSRVVISVVASEADTRYSYFETQYPACPDSIYVCEQRLIQKDDFDSFHVDYEVRRVGVSLDCPFTLKNLGIGSHTVAA